MATSTAGSHHHDRTTPERNRRGTPIRRQPARSQTTPNTSVTAYTADNSFSIDDITPTTSQAYFGQPPLAQSHTSYHDASPRKKISQWSRMPIASSLQLMPPPPAPVPSLASSASLTPSTYFSSPSSVSSGQFGFYPQEYPTNPYYLDTNPYIPRDYSEWSISQDEDVSAQYLNTQSMDTSDLESDIMTQSVKMSDIVSRTDCSVAPSSTISKASTSQSKPPRPANAWILYRSEKLKAIERGDNIPGLDEIMAGLDLPSSASPSNESADGASSVVTSKSKKRNRPPKKGTRPPTEGLLSLGRGKLGRGLPQANISKMISALWKGESSAVRQRYENMANAKKREHELKYPDYKFQPRRKADKVREREERERQKEAERQEKRAEKETTRPRRSRTLKKRFSPIATGSRSMRSTPTYSHVPSLAGESGAESGWGGNSQNLATPLTGSPDPTADHRLRSYPFPMPPGSLPSMRPEDHAGNNPYGDQLVMNAQGFSMTPQSSQKTGVRRTIRPTPAENVSQAPVADTGQAIQYPQPQSQASHSAQQAILAPVPQRAAAPSIIDIPSHMQIDVPQGLDIQNELSFTYGPEPVEETPGLNLSKPQATWQQNTSPQSKAGKLAAMWSAFDEEDDAEEDLGELPRVVLASQGDVSAQAFVDNAQILPGDAPSGNGGQVAPAQAEEYYCHTGPWTVVMPDGQSLEYTMPMGEATQDLGEIDWYDPNTDWSQFVLAMPADPTSQVAQNTDPSQFIIPTGVVDPSQMIPLQAVIEEEHGPFLSQAPVLSPVDASWTLSPSNGQFQEGVLNAQPGGSRVPSYSVTTADGQVLPFNVVPRHISGFSSLTDGIWAGNDRNLSFAMNAGVVNSGSAADFVPEMDISEDLFWSSFEMAPPVSAQNLAAEVQSNTTESTEASEAASSAPTSIQGLAEPIDGASIAIETTDNAGGLLSENGSEDWKMPIVPECAPRKESSGSESTSVTKEEPERSNEPEGSIDEMDSTIRQTRAAAARGAKRGRAVGRTFDMEHS
ncbi:hypothetical protein BD324DRAFT_650981 [Kockovaella imperatae]|uniref:HMG box domain-containing protein n=1 Tax=Kockovaella imperatae TaxID=4999 RepID=A0A1Y1UJS7_9TREE|nr:hypothetical protein BD324DRAFT_650981 [Kockovaella imperatae]ORX37385.1 hypothetical protein BD324DRAFT_650981 [Kockovaella imperatae]